MSLSRAPIEDIPIPNDISMDKRVGVRGPTLACLAMVWYYSPLGILLLYELWQSCGKPSTKFPHGGLVECLYIPDILLHSSQKIPKFRKFSIFLENSHISKSIGQVKPHGSGAGIVSSTFYHIYLNLQYILDKKSCELFLRK